MYGLELVIFQYMGVKLKVFSKKKNTTEEFILYIAIAIFFVSAE